jgi:hypothetical protein
MSRVRGRAFMSRSPLARLHVVCKIFCSSIFLWFSFLQGRGSTRFLQFFVFLFFYFWDFYFRALGSLVVLSFPQPLNFFSVFPSL